MSRNCPTCLAVAIGEDHRCPPAWHVWTFADGHGGDTLVYGYDASEAAEHYREHDADDYESPDELDISVREVGTETWIHLTVYREMRPTFTGVERSAAPEDFEPEREDGR